MSSKSKTVVLWLGKEYDYIHCIRLVRLIGSLGVKEAKEFVDKLAFLGEEKTLLVSKARLTYAVTAEMTKHGLGWKEE